MTPDIRTLAEDELITEPGFYNIPLDRHHSQPCDGVSVTSGVLRDMLLKTPADVWAFHQLNPNPWEKPVTKALTLGRAMAAWVEGGAEQVKREYFVLTENDPLKPTDNMRDTYEENALQNFDRFMPIPEDAPRRPLEGAMRRYREGEQQSPMEKRAAAYWDAMEKSETDYIKLKDFNNLRDIKTRVDFWNAHDADPRDKLTVNDFKMISDMGRALSEDVGASVAMGGIPEVTMAYQDDVTGLWILSRPDTINFDGTVTDFKKMNTQGGPFTYRLVDDRITDHAYDMQLALAAEAMERLTGNWPSMAAIVAQWDKPPHHVILREIDEDDLRIGQFRNRQAINQFAECLQSGHWPGPGEDVATYQRPEWQVEMLNQQMATAGYAP